jgi:hypothetical protein
MSISPYRTWLYRNRRAAVIFSAMVLAGAAVGVRPLHAQAVTQQFGRKPTSKGPRALGLVQIKPNGKARLIPIAIIMDGKFFDAGAYKATPVPMALDFGIIYEGMRTGVSQGIFTITQPGQLNHNWIAEGTWLPVGVKAPETTKKYAAPVIDDNGGKDDRPTLHRRSEGSSANDDDRPVLHRKDDSSADSKDKDEKPASAPDSKPADSKDASKDATKDKPSDAGKDATKDTAKATAPEKPKRDDLDQPISDPNRPILRRGKPDPNAHHEPFVNFDAPEESHKTANGAAKPKEEAAPVIQTVTAISDAGGPDTRPYTYDLKPTEEAIYRNKMLELAGTMIRPAGQAAAQASGATTSAGKKPTAKPSSKTKPSLDIVSLKIFDLSTSNEPILVLSARTPVPPAGTPGAQVPQEITLIARTNLEGELQKLFFAQTDSHHLDVSPRMELIDAVDADGDGRGELLFRQTSEAGSAYAIYRVTADRLWSLYEGTP